MEMKILGSSDYFKYWRDIFSAASPRDAIEKIEGNIPSKISNVVDFDFYPEPFFGPMEEIKKNDAILLLINPGNIEGSEEEVKLHNELTKERYLKWNRNDYLISDCEVAKHNKKGIAWRDATKRSVERILNREVEFLHTVEFFPFHSKSWNVSTREVKNYILNMNATKHSMDFIRHLCKRNERIPIIGIGKPWIDVFQAFGHEPIQEKIIIKAETGNASHRFYQFQFSSDSSPIVIYSASSMKLPNNDKAMEIMRSFGNFK